MIEIKKQYAVFDAKVLSKIPRGPLKDKKKAQRKTFVVVVVSFTGDQRFQPVFAGFQFCFCILLSSVGLQFGCVWFYGFGLVGSTSCFKSNISSVCLNQFQVISNWSCENLPKNFRSQKFSCKNTFYENCQLNKFFLNVIKLFLKTTNQKLNGSCTWHFQYIDAKCFANLGQTMNFGRSGLTTKRLVIPCIFIANWPS